jgi:hypothetical protein
MLRTIWQRVLNVVTLGYYQPQLSTPAVLALMRSNISVIETNEERVDEAIRSEVRRALDYDRSRNLYEKRLAKLSDTRWQIEQILFATEDAHVTGAIVNHLRQAGVALREVKSSVNVKDVEKLMDNIKDDMDFQSDVNDAISSPLSGDTLAVNDDDLSEELESLRAQRQDEVEMSTLRLAAAPAPSSSMAAAIGTEDWPTVTSLPPLPVVPVVVSPMSTMPLSALPPPPPHPKQAVALTSAIIGSETDHTF